MFVIFDRKQTKWISRLSKIGQFTFDSLINHCSSKWMRGSRKREKNGTSGAGGGGGGVWQVREPLLHMPLTSQHQEYQFHPDWGGLHFWRKSGDTCCLTSPNIENLFEALRVSWIKQSCQTRWRFLERRRTFLRMTRMFFPPPVRHAATPEGGAGTNAPAQHPCFTPSAGQRGWEAQDRTARTSDTDPVSAVLTWKPSGTPSASVWSECCTRRRAK